MHELSIAQNILEIVLAHLPARESHSVKSVKLRVGKQSGVVPDSLDFCFGVIAQGTPLEGVALTIERVPFILKCKTCGSSFQSESGIVLCPSCGDMDVEVLSGTELQVVEIDLVDSEDEQATPSDSGRITECLQ